MLATDWGDMAGYQKVVSFLCYCWGLTLLTTFIATKMIATPVLLVLSRGNRLSICVEDLGCNFGLKWIPICGWKLETYMYSLGCFIFMKFILHSNYRICCTVIYISILFGTLFCNILKSLLLAIPIISYSSNWVLFCLCSFICQFDIVLSVVLEMQIFQHILDGANLRSWGSCKTQTKSCEKDGSQVNLNSTRYSLFTYLKSQQTFKSSCMFSLYL
jgi:hypothetical protein